MTESLMVYAFKLQAMLGKYGPRPRFFMGWSEEHQEFRSMQMNTRFKWLIGYHIAILLPQIATLGYLFVWGLWQPFTKNFFNWVVSVALTMIILGSINVEAIILHERHVIPLFFKEIVRSYDLIRPRQGECLVWMNFRGRCGHHRHSKFLLHLCTWVETNPLRKGMMTYILGDRSDILGLFACGVVIIMEFVPYVVIVALGYLHVIVGIRFDPFSYMLMSLSPTENYYEELLQSWPYTSAVEFYFILFHLEFLRLLTSGFLIVIFAMSYSYKCFYEIGRPNRNIRGSLFLYKMVTILRFVLKNTLDSGIACSLGYAYVAFMMSVSVALLGIDLLPRLFTLAIGGIAVACFVAIFFVFYIGLKEYEETKALIQMWKGMPNVGKCDRKEILSLQPNCISFGSMKKVTGEARLQYIYSLVSRTADLSLCIREVLFLS